MDNRLIAKFCNSDCILLVNSQGLLKKLYCPFRVKVIEPISMFKVGTCVWVEEVGTTSRDELIYVIYSVPYRHIHFQVLLSF